MMNTEITDMCAWLRGVNSSLKLSLHTNGSTGTAVSYQRLANLVDFIAFGIDGLEDTNHLYRRQTRWSTIVRNATAFIQAGGAAYWDFIVFQHNEHQVESAQQLSQSMGFKKFNIKKTYRFLNRNHELTPSLTVGTYILKPPTQEQYLNKFTQQINPVDIAIYQRTTKISCFYLSKQEIYIGADGFVFPCGWLHDRLYGVESETSADHETIKQMMQEAGGKDRANCFKTPLIDIVNGAWFQVIAENWKTNRLQRCAMMCGTGLNFVGDQNEHVSY